MGAALYQAMSISVIVGPITIRPGLKPSGKVMVRDELVKALRATRDLAVAEGRALEYEAYCTVDGVLQNLSTAAATPNEPYYLREVYPSVEAQKDHAAHSEALAGFREFKQEFANFKDPTCPVIIPRATVSEGSHICEEEFLQQVAMAKDLERVAECSEAQKELDLERKKSMEKEAARMVC